MTLDEFLSGGAYTRKIGMSEERLKPIIPILRQYIAFFREYPDIFVDFMQTGWVEGAEKPKFQLYFYQRVFLRVSLRFRKTYFVFPRGWIYLPDIILIAGTLSY